MLYRKEGLCSFDSNICVLGLKREVIDVVDNIWTFGSMLRKGGKCHVWVYLGH